MILLKISSKDEQTIIKTAEILLKEQFAIDINISSNEKRFELLNSDIKSTNMYILTAKTKALLFSKITNRLKETFPINLPEIFSLPITTMETEQAENVINNTQKV